MVKREKELGEIGMSGVRGVRGRTYSMAAESGDRCADISWIAVSVVLGAACLFPQLLAYV